jgi:hypothetical protein
MLDHQVAFELVQPADVYLPALDPGVEISVLLVDQLPGRPKPVIIDPYRPKHLLHLDPGLLFELPARRIQALLARFDPATWRRPPRVAAPPIFEPKEEDPVGRVEQDDTRPESTNRHRL